MRKDTRPKKGTYFPIDRPAVEKLLREERRPFIVFANSKSAIARHQEWDIAEIYRWYLYLFSLPENIPVAIALPAVSYAIINLQRHKRTCPADTSSTRHSLFARMTSDGKVRIFLQIRRIEKGRYRMGSKFTNVRPQEHIVSEKQLS